jgi:hypothetical protein
MMINLVVSVPNSADRDEVKQRLTQAALQAEGITIVTPRRYYVDVDVVSIDVVMEVAQ